jgi:hypothetical protein
MLIAVAIVSAILIYFVFNIQRLRRRERKSNVLIARQKEELHQKEKDILIQAERNLQIELDDQNRRLTSYALNMARTNEFIANTTEELRQILRELESKEPSRTEKIRSMISGLHQFSSGNDWEEFRLYFEKVHQSFEKNLLAEFPDLTLHDRKICALLKLGLSNKDIASITFRELRSVESARNRLRKKLGLSADMSLHQFLSRF